MIERKQPVNIAISIGDLNSIGPEVALKAFSDQRMFDLCTPIFFASRGLINFYKKHFDIRTKVQPIQLGAEPKKGAINVVDTFKPVTPEASEKYKVDFGKRDKVSAHFAVQSFVAATKALKKIRLML